MTFEELLAALDNSGWDGAEGYKADVQTYVSGVSAGSNARIAELEKQVQDLGEKLQATQADNYKLMVANTARMSDNGAAGDGDEPGEFDFNSLIKSN